MATERQIAANQLNALKGTGRRTSEGREVSSHNALKHGLSARNTIILDDENEDEFLALRQSLRVHFAPLDPLDQIFVDRLAAHFWWLQCVPKFEAMLLQANPPAGPDEEGPQASTSAALQQLMARQDYILPRDVLGKLSRHEAHLLREIHRIMKVLQQRPERPAAMAANFPSGQNTKELQVASDSNVVDDTHDRTLRSLSQPRHLPG